MVLFIAHCSINLNYTSMTFPWIQGITSLKTKFFVKNNGAFLMKGVGDAMTALNQQQVMQLRKRLKEEKAELEKHFELNDHFGLSESQSDSTGELSTYDNHPADVASELYER